MKLVKAWESRAFRKTLVSVGLGSLAVLPILLGTGRVAAQEPAACLSPNPAAWPPAARPYFMLAVDTSGSMIGCTNPSGTQYDFPDSCPNTATPNSCGLEPTRLNDAKCALRKTVQTFAGEVNFGMATFAINLSGCNNVACGDSCTANDGNCDPPNGVGTEGEFYTGAGCSVSGFANATPATSCGNRPDCGSTNQPIFGDDWRNGGKVVVDMLQDPVPWTPPGTPPASNVSTLLEWFDGQCNGSRELFAIGSTPLEGILRTVHQYLAAGWSTGWTDGNYCTTGGPAITNASPINAGEDPPCRALNVILVTDGDETCSGTATSASAALWNTGVTVQGQTVRIRTHVINFAGGNQTATDDIADAGDDGNSGNNSATSYFANNETQLSQALSNIIAGAIKPEVCNNADDNCNGCTDEGYKHYCNLRPTCCAWTTTPQRLTCLTNYQNSITPTVPGGNLDLLPCTTAAQQTQPANWLCFDPKEVCDNVDNNCSGATDEGFNKCGNPLACPSAEICDGDDDDCDNIVDNAPGNPNPFSLPNCTPCVPSAEICDGCDNDCDRIADDGIAPTSCGFTPPANCAGTQSCGTATPVSTPNGCLPGFPRSRWGTCVNNPATEDCDGIDDDCDGIVDDGILPTPCEVPNSSGLIYQPDTLQPPLPSNRINAASQCKRGQRPCNGQCTGWVGPSTEICDGIDNDCDGQVDEGVPGVGNQCGSAVGQCRRGTTACIGGQIVCQGGSPPQPEVCNGLDDDCDGTPDDAPVDDAPVDPACWGLPPTGCNPVCNHQNLNWCPPAGGTCKGPGSLATPCQTGTLVCDGVNRWKCLGGVVPSTEVCDGTDNNCNQTIDDGLGPPFGQACGSNVGECRPGTRICNNGAPDCQGEIGPTAEICDGKDNNCNGQTDEGLPIGGSCFRDNYDKTQYPGDRTKGECTPGTLVCNPATGRADLCIGGTGPEPEICDKKDNDCDGQIDEAGGAPDGLDGTSDPQDPSRHLGGECGVQIGECKKGNLVCVNGQVVCAGIKGPTPELCDCLDNDCNGTIDDGPAPDAGTPLCTGEKRCVNVAPGACQCAGPCKSGEFPCPQGTECKTVTVSGTTEEINRCVNDPCGDCATKTHVNQQTGATECAPTGNLPKCVCKGNDGCRSPCFGTTCQAGQDCARFGPSAGTCQPQNNCNFFPCPTGEACHNGACVADPCSPNPCPADQVCKPNPSFMDHRCVGSCAAVTCPTGQECRDGTCTDTGCAQGCPTGQFCQQIADGGFACGPNRCGGDAGQPCLNGGYCDPATGSCGDDPCSGVKCPAGQACVLGECFTAQPPDAGTGGSGGGGSSGTGGVVGSGGSSGSGGRAGTGVTPGGGATPGTEPPRGTWGLATGGGGCGCRAPTNRMTPLSAALVALAMAAIGLRRRSRSASPAEGRRPERPTTRTTEQSSKGAF